ncbi:MAG: chemotaxis protein CheW [Cyanobacteria bacterium P01_D01_bin.156]
MAIVSPIKSRRLRAHRGKAVEQFIVFPIQREWFALPIFSVKKVVPKSEIHGNCDSSGAGLTVYEGKELLVLDISHQVFGNILTTESNNPSLPSSEKSSNAEYLLIIRNRQGDLVGLPVASAPSVHRFPKSDIAPLPSSYATRVNMQCVSGLIVQADDQPIIFLLNPEQFLSSQFLLPPTS